MSTELTITLDLIFIALFVTLVCGLLLYQASHIDRMRREIRDIKATQYFNPTINKDVPKYLVCRSSMTWLGETILTKGKFYKVIREDTEDFIIVNDTGGEHHFSKNVSNGEIYTNWFDEVDDLNLTNAKDYDHDLPRM